MTDDTKITKIVFIQTQKFNVIERAVQKQKLHQKVIKKLIMIKKQT